MSDYIIPTTLGTDGKPRSRDKVIRLKSPFITADELVAEAERNRTAKRPATDDEALHAAGAVLRMNLEHLLEEFPYRDHPTHTVALHARCLAAALANVDSALDRRRKEQERSEALARSVQAILAQNPDLTTSDSHAS